MSEELVLYPWGHIWQQAGSVRQMRFAGMRERGGSTVLDLMLARRYNSGIGR